MAGRGLNTGIVTALFASLAAVAAVTSAAAQAPIHPLADTGYATATARTVTEADIAAALQTGTIVILGEAHDNDGHHRRQAGMVTGLAGRKPGLVFEQMTTDTQPALDTLLAKGDAVSPDAVKQAVGWAKSGWAKYNYDPLLSAALDARLPLYGGDVSREMIRKVAKEGLGVLPADARATLALDTPLPDALLDATLTEIEQNHCGVMPKAAFTGMAEAQRYRDATLADVTLAAAVKHGSAILITGNVHARTDRGVPWYLRQRAPDQKIISVMLLEVEDGKTDPDAYVPRAPDGRPAADYLIFTARADRPDPCEEMRARMTAQPPAPPAGK